jgi:hypothetical protein
MRLTFLPATGCEGLAHYIFNRTEEWLEHQKQLGIITNGPLLWAVEVSEHEGNSASYFREG